METAKSRPYSLLSTSTHDTKRSEDVKARINVLSEIPGEWQRCLSRWSRLNGKKKPVVDGRMVPNRNDEYLFYQTLLGVWPVTRMNVAEYRDFTARIRDYMLKASREAKVDTNWSSPNVPYEEALLTFIDAALASSPANTFFKDFALLKNKLAYFGMFNSLAQTLLKVTSPGVPDFYQGTELWDFSLVDPDNRRPIDFVTRKQMLARLKQELARPKADAVGLARKLLRTWPDGLIKLYLTFLSLGYRKAHARLFKEGGYVSLTVEGQLREHVCAFARHGEGDAVLVIVPRFLTHLVRSINHLPLGPKVWQGSGVVLPEETPGSTFVNIFTGETIRAAKQHKKRILRLGEVFANFPVALLNGET